MKLIAPAATHTTATTLPMIEPSLEERNFFTLVMPPGSWFKNM